MSDQSGYPSRPAYPADPIPLLPRGQLLFESIPLNAVVMEALAPALGHGALVVRDRDRGAVVLVRDGTLVEAHSFSGGNSRTGDAVLPEVQAWADAVVSAHRLDALLVDVCESLLRGEVIYTDLHLEWVEWPALLADFRRRGGAYALEIFTAGGRGVTCVAGGQQALSYTDIHPALGDPTLLESMAQTKDGTIRVRRLNAATFAGTSLASAAQPRPVPDAEVAGAPAAGDRHEVEPQPSPQPGAEPGALTDEDGAAGPTSTEPVGEEVLPDLTWVAPWQTPWRDDPVVSDEHATETTRTPLVGDVVIELRSIAQRRLQLSAARVEAVLDDAARDNRTLSSVLDEIRAMSIRGVMPATVDAMVEEMSAAAAEHRSV